MMEDFVVQYLNEKPRLIQNLDAFREQRGINLLTKLANERNEVNLRSWRSEVEFGFFFNVMADDMKFEQPIDGKEPDWTIWMNGQKIIAEVLRLNTPEEELLRNMENDKAIDRFMKENPGFRGGFGGPAKVLSSEYFYGHQTRLGRKEEKYREIVKRHELPFLVCIESTVDTYVSERDTFDFLIQYNNKGYFYRNNNFGRTVTGVLLRTYFGQFFYFDNNFAEYKLNKTNSLIFDKYSYKEVG